MYVILKYLIAHGHSEDIFGLPSIKTSRTEKNYCIFQYDELNDSS